MRRQEGDVQGVRKFLAPKVTREQNAIGRIWRETGMEDLTCVRARA